MKKNNKATGTYSKEQLEQLCQDLTIKVTSAYEAADETLDFTKTSPKYYDRLANAITNAYELKKFEDSVPYYKIKPTWLRDLFTSYRKKLTATTIQKLHFKACYCYLGFDTERVYWESKVAPSEDIPYCEEELYDEELENHWGKYQVYWKDASSSKPIYKYDLVLNEYQSCFMPVTEINHPIYTGNRLRKEAGNIWVELMHPTQKERCYMTFNVGILQEPEILSGLLLGLDNSPIPVAFPVLLVKNTCKMPIDANRITQYFGQFVSVNGLTKGLRASRMRDLFGDASNTHENSRLQRLQGAWIFYLLVAGAVERFKLYFSFDNRIMCESTFNSYVDGTLESLGSTLKIELRNHNAYTSLLFEVGTILKLENLRHPIQVSYLSNERLRHDSGKGVLIRTILPYDDIIVPYSIEPDSEEYENLRRQGILNLLI